MIRITEINTDQIKTIAGQYQSSHILNVGDTVLLASGNIGRIVDIKQSNYLPRFQINGKWYGKTKIKGKIQSDVP